MMLLLVLLFFLFARPSLSQQPPEQIFHANCAGCHGEQGRGTAKAPGLAMNPRIASQSAGQLGAFLERGNIANGMPSFSDLPAGDRAALVQYLRQINVGTGVRTEVDSEPARKVTWGAPQPGDWLTYNGNGSANRYSPLHQINLANVSSLTLKWIFPMQSFGLETTPLAADGVLYVTGQNEVFALDALTGSPLWHYSRPASPGLTGDAKLGTNRGVAILRDKVFFITDNAHLLALDRATGELLWETPMAAEETGQHYGGTMAPLIVDDAVVAGVSGADEGIRGFVAAYRPENGALLWRHWTVPRAGEPGIETWLGKEPLTGGGSTWTTGSYDPSSDTLYWATGNPWPDSNDAGRPGDNLFTDCVLALNPRTGDVKWYYQFTPHDVEDRDAAEPNVLVDTVYRGKPSKLLLHADRNGFFYVLDRTNGKLLLARPFLRRVDWASGIGPDGRPVVKDPRGCPNDGANWDSTAFSPQTRLYYLLALEECVGDKPGGYPNETGQRFLRAVNIDTGEIAWEVSQPGAAHAKTWTGVLATAGGLIFYGQPNGGFAAVDQRNGKTLWQLPTNVRMKASPMTFMAGGNQYIAVAAGPNILCFGLQR
ncbi:MAG TPA: PQQ-binding-like beta-propeller repeat protein [Acidobacteriaceae bacterium]|nr:PQQ-binding-like beta-propeller repeat protein [Acidobacteriaceae bacterium]